MHWLRKYEKENRLLLKNYIENQVQFNPPEPGDGEEEEQ